MGVVVAAAAAAVAAEAAALVRMCVCTVISCFQRSVLVQNFHLKAKFHTSSFL